MTWKRSDIRRARQMPLKPVLEQQGYRLEARQNGNYRILGLTTEIMVKNHYWVCPDNGAAGNSIDFFVKIEGVSFNKAMELLSPVET